MSDAPRDAANQGVPPPLGPGPVSLGLFLLSAVILFGAILTGYALLRITDPDAFTWAPKLRDRRLGLASAAALVVSSLAAAGALRFALTAKRGAARGLLAVALLAGLAAVAIRVVELPSTSVRAGWAPKRAEVREKPRRGAAAVPVTHVGDASAGKRVFLGTCAACHAPDGSGVKGQGQSLRDSTFFKDKTDERVLAFVKIGRQPFDPESKLHLSMPARGGNPALTDASLLDAIAYVRELQKQAAAVAKSPTPSAGRPTALATSPDQPQVIDGELWIPHSILPAAQSGPTGSARATIALQKPGAVGRADPNVRRFFSLLLLVDSLHTTYLVFGLLLGVWLLVSPTCGGSREASISMAAAYWVVIGATGLMILPAFYF